MSWRIRQFFNQYGSYLVIAALLFTAYAHVTGGGGTAGRVVRNGTRWVYQVPVVGSFLRGTRNFAHSTYVSFGGGSHRRSYHVARGGRRHHARRHHRRRRH